MATETLFSRVYWDIRIGLDDPYCQPTIDDVIAYRKRFKDRVRTQDDLSVIRYLDNLIWENKHSSVNQVRKPSTDSEVVLAFGFSNKMFESVLPKLAAVLERENQWVCVYHELLYFRFIKPISFLKWVKWLNERLETIKLPSVLKGGGANHVDSAFTDPNKLDWQESDYCGNSCNGKKKNTFLDMCDALSKVRTVFYDELLTIPDRYYLKS